ncbi:MAG: site-specific DNA-methyltransferase [Saprospiraceae bacterium]|nr:MAG: site-specific DNA-methyltransferase [Saprospiraceae bacterium]
MLDDLRRLYDAITNPQEHGEFHEQLKVDIRSLYRHEHISPELLMQNLFRYVEEKSNPNQGSLFSANELFGNTFDRDELEKVPAYYQQPNGWSNRLIQGDSLLVMSSLLEREGMAGKVQMVYIDPPYGIKYGGNWQMKLNDRDVKDGSDEYLSGEPEQIRAYRDTWELGIHSYLGYLKERLLVAKELLTESGSCFVQISDENVHLVRCLMDEVFGSENFVSMITFQKTGSMETVLLGTTADYIIWYAKDKSLAKYRQLYCRALGFVHPGYLALASLA